MPARFLLETQAGFCMIRFFHAGQIMILMAC